MDSGREKDLFYSRISTCRDCKSLKAISSTVLEKLPIEQSYQTEETSSSGEERQTHRSDCITKGVDPATPGRRYAKVQEPQQNPFGLRKFELDFKTKWESESRRDQWTSIRIDTNSIFQFSSVAQLCPTLCDPMNHSTPGLPVHHQLPEFTQTHIHRVGDAIQPPHPLSSPSPPAPNPSQH